MVFGLFRKDAEREAALDLYADIVVQARRPVFYDDWQVPDTKDGRFDLITLHMFLVLRRLKQESGKTGRFSQKLFDVMFQNMDHSLREMGVGDLTVGKKVRGLAEAFYGRIGAYDAAMAETSDEKLSDAIARNIYDGSVSADQAARLASYVRSADQALAAQSIDRLMLGVVSFPTPMAATAGSAAEGDIG